MSLTLQSIYSPLPANQPQRTPFREKFARFFDAVITHSAGYQSTQDACRLNALSDQKLAKIGLKRDEIVQYAFRKHMMI